MESKGNQQILIETCVKITDAVVSGLDKEKLSPESIAQARGLQESLRHIHSGFNLSSALSANRVNLNSLGLKQFPSSWEEVKSNITTLRDENITGDILADLLINKWGYRVSQAREVLKRENFTTESIPDRPQTLKVCCWPQDAEDGLKSMINLLRGYKVSEKRFTRFGILAEKTCREKLTVQAHNYNFPEGFTPLHQQGERLSRQIRRREVDIFSFWDGLKGIGMFSGEKKLPLTQDTFPNFISNLVFAHLEGDAITHLLHMDLLFDIPKIAKYLTDLGFSARVMPLAPGDYPMLEVSRFPENQDSTPENYNIIYMEELSPVRAAEYLKEIRPWQAKLCGIQPN